MISKWTGSWRNHPGCHRRGILRAALRVPPRVLCHPPAEVLLRHPSSTHETSLSKALILVGSVAPRDEKWWKRLWKVYVLSQLFRMEWVNYIQIIPVSPQKNIYPLAMLCKSGKTGRPWSLLTSKARNWPKDHLVLPLDTGDVTSLKFQGPRTSGKHNKNDGKIHHLKNSYVKLPDNFGILWNFMIFHHPAAICNIWENETSWNINHGTNYWIPNPNLRWPSLIIDWIMDSFFSDDGVWIGCHHISLERATCNPEFKQWNDWTYELWLEQQINHRIL